MPALPRPLLIATLGGLIAAAAAVQVGCGRPSDAAAIPPINQSDLGSPKPTAELAADPALPEIRPIEPLPFPNLDGLDTAEGASRTLAPLPARETSVPELPRIWMGVYSHYPNMVAVRLELRPAEERGDWSERGRFGGGRTMAEQTQAIVASRPESATGLTGRAIFYRLIDPAKAAYQSEPTPELTEVGECAVRGWYDAANHVVGVRSGDWQWAAQPVNDAMKFAFALTRTPDGGRLSGRMAHGQRGDAFPITLASDSANAKRLVRIAIDDPRQLSVKPNEWLHKRRTEVRGSRRGPPPRKVGSPEEVASIVRLGRLFGEHIAPEHESRWRIGDHFEHAMSPFGEPFEHAVGIAYEDLTQTDRYRLGFVLNEVYQGLHGERASYEVEDLNAMRLFASGSPGWKMNVAELWTHQATTEWARGRIEAFGTQRVDDQSWSDAERFVVTSKRIVRGLSPKEQGELHDLVQSTRKRVAEATLASLGLEADEDLFDNLVAVAGDTEAGREAVARRRAGERLALLASLRDEAASFAASPGEFAESARFRKRLTSEYGVLVNTQTHRAVVEYVDRRRQRLLDASSDRVVALCRVASTERQLSEAVAGVLLTQSERESDAGRAVSDALKAGAARVERLEALAHYSPQEQAWMSANGPLRIVMPAEVPEPTAESIRRAWVREIGSLPACSVVSPGVARFSAPGFNLLKITSDIHVGQVRKAMHADGRTAEDAGEGFRCYYRIETRMKPSGTSAELLSQPGPQSALLNYLIDLANKSSGTKTMRDDFVLTPEGWRSPTLRARGLEGQAEIYRTLGEAAQEAADSMLSAPLMLPGGKSGYRIRRFRSGRKVFTRYERL